MTDPRHIPEPVHADTAGISLKILLRSAESGGAISLFEEITAPDAGPPLHVHANEDEFFRVLEGSYRFRAGDADIDAGPGDTLFVPRGTPHCFCNMGETPGRLFMGFSPGGGEAFFDWLAENGLPDPADSTQAAEMRERFGVSFLGPNPFQTKHG